MYTTYTCILVLISCIVVFFNPVKNFRYGIQLLFYQVFIFDSYILQLKVPVNTFYKQSRSFQAKKK